ncbi:hypothetical protein [Providencia phage PSTCR6]|nr:hypothetical protein [Providencia phage PSTCR6]
MKVTTKETKAFEGVFKGLTDEQYKDAGLSPGQLDDLIGKTITGKSFVEVIEYGDDTTPDEEIEWVDSAQSVFTIPMVGFK